MKRGRSILLFGLVFSLLITSMATSSFALSGTASQQEKVKLLDDLRIFTGSNGDYRLNDKLSRSEAAALAVRILGKDLHVLLNSATYRNTTYPDVDPAKWYAPYVGYCTAEGILSGDTTGNYKPEEFITEKSFLKIVLGVLGYAMNSDFTWDGVFKKAFEIGLVKDLSYIAKVEDNVNFTRGNAVNILYNALTIKGKVTGKELFYNLIDAGTLTVNDAKEFGLIEEGKEGTGAGNEDEKEETPAQDKLVTEIEELLVFDENTISIIFNENIKSIQKIKIYEVYSEDKELSFSIEEMKDDHLLINTQKHKPGKEYTVELQQVEDNNGNIRDVIYSAFIGYTPGIVESDFFRIQKIEPVNEKSVKLYFTHPVNANCEIAPYYSVTRNGFAFASGDQDQLLARTINSENNSILLSLKSSSFTVGEQYAVEIDGDMVSTYGVRLNDGAGDEMAFTAVQGEFDTFKVIEVIPYDRKTILLSFNKEVNPFLAQQIYNFYVTDKEYKPIQIENVTIESQGNRAGEVVYIKLGKNLELNGKYYITINNLNDISRQEYITERTYSFIADYGSADKLDLVDVTALDTQTVEVYFTNMPNPADAQNKNYFYVTLRSGSGTTKINPVYALYDKAIHPYRTTLIFNKGDLIPNREYILYVNYEIKDYIGNKADLTLKEFFHASGEDKTSPIIEDATPISTDAIKLVFDKELAFNQTNLSPGNYALEYSYLGMSIKKIPLSVLYVDAKTLVLKFDKLEYDVHYSLKFNALVDYTGETFKVTGDGTNYVEFELKESN